MEALNKKCNIEFSGVTSELTETYSELNIFKAERFQKTDFLDVKVYIKLRNKL